LIQEEFTVLYYWSIAPALPASGGGVIRRAGKSVSSAGITANASSSLDRNGPIPRDGSARVAAHKPLARSDAAILQRPEVSSCSDYRAGSTDKLALGMHKG